MDLAHSWLGLLIIPLFGLCFRLRGGLLGDSIHQIFSWWGSTTARILFWGINGGVMLGLLTGNAKIGLVIGLLLYATSTIGWFHALGLGDMRDGKLSFGRDFWVMVARGLIWTAPIIALAFFGYPHWWWFFLGVVCPLCYQLSWFITKPTPIIGGRNNIPYGELMFGSVIGLAFYLTVVL